MAADVSPIKTFPGPAASTSTSPPTARKKSRGAIMVAIGIRHPFPKRRTSSPSRTWLVRPTVGNFTLCPTAPEVATADTILSASVADKERARDTDITGCK